MLVNTLLKDIITKEFAWHYRVIPFENTEKTVGFYSDYNFDKSEDVVLEELEVVFGKEIKILKKETSEIEKSLILNYRLTETKQDFNDSFLDSIIKEAIDLGSSDIHCEIYEEDARIRLRIDGVLIEKRKIEKEEYQEIVNRIKIQSNLEITEKRLPQDGRTRISNFDIRVSILPTHFGEKIVMRILGQDTSNIQIDSLGLESKEKAYYLEAVKKSNGIILISGPTGSGKTTTLYATLKMVNTVEKNILTVEDPIEYTLRGVNQVQLNDKIGLSFSSTLRSFLRQDPDIIMLGEIRDKETAEMAIRASLTGHLVMSTVHTNSAWGTVSRLIDMGIPPYLLAETLNVTVAQRLVRKLCKDCKKKTKAIQEEFPASFELPRKIAYHYEAVGCEYCYYTGYKGRRAIYEILPIDQVLSKEIRTNGQDIRDILKEKKIESLSDKAFNLLETGETSLNEVYSIFINNN